MKQILSRLHPEGRRHRTPGNMTLQPDSKVPEIMGHASIHPSKNRSEDIWSNRLIELMLSR
jgi:hypothetical protein